MEITMQNFINAILDPARYHGHNKKPPFFEGWYYKLVSADEKSIYAIIPGVILSGDSHAFVQVLDGSSGDTQYHRFPAGEFQASRNEFDVRIGPNRFNLHGMSLDLDDEISRVRGKITLGTAQPWPVSWRSPGIMGWYAWLPFMECYHGVLSFDHRLEGSLAFDGQEIDFSGGRGYIEKDWGKSFPEAYVWMQSNHFQQPRVSLVASLAVIPWLGSAFPGFIVGLWQDGSLHRFATYTGARLIDLQVTDTDVEMIFEDKTHRLALSARRGEGGLIKGPTTQDMGQHIHESLQSRVQAELSTLEGEILFSGTGFHAGLEVFEHEKLFQLIHKHNRG